MLMGAPVFFLKTEKKIANKYKNAFFGIYFFPFLWYDEEKILTKGKIYV